MAFSQHARACTLNPTLPCPTLPLPPRALSDFSIIPAAGRLCLKSVRADGEHRGRGIGSGGCVGRVLVEAHSKVLSD